jgi:hypothetical protein
MTRFLRPLLAATFAVATLSGCSELLGVDLGGGGGGGGGAGEPIPADDLEGVQAFGTVIRGTDGVVRARLDVVTMSGEPRFLTGIIDPRLHIDDTSVPLATTGAVGVFETTSQRTSALRFAPDARYRFSFAILDDQGVEHAYEGTVVAPTSTPDIEVPDLLIRYAGEPIEVDLSGHADGGYLRVHGPAGVTFDTAAVRSLSELHQFRQYFARVSGPTFTIDGGAFPSPGSYRIEFTTLAIAGPGPRASTSEPLGALSFFGAGPTASVFVQVE